MQRDFPVLWMGINAATNLSAVESGQTEEELRLTHRRGESAAVWASLITTLVCDLCLNAPPHNRKHSRMEIRAVLATFPVISATSALENNVSAIGWTPYMYECLLTVDEDPEWEGDRILAAQVRWHLIMGNKYRVKEKPIVSPPSETGVLLLSLEAQLRNLRASLTTGIIHYCIIMMYYCVTRIIVHGSTLNPYPQRDALGVPDYRRPESLHKVLEASTS
ncbi:hypothetical protein F5Y15DRAFT_401397 [Xylariaceae sp. FL0016]|nr:hypothetical protein F5Y15DRAFT_401397 [Xylariaceae sp. FL0016]